MKTTVLNNKENLNKMQCEREKKKKQRNKKTKQLVKFKNTCTF